MTTLEITARGYTGEQDLPTIVELLNRCAQASPFGEGTTADELRMEFSLPRFDPLRHLRLWEDASGALIGFGQLWIHDEAAEPDSFLWYRVRPDLRDGALDELIIAWGAEQTRTMVRERGVQLRLRTTTITTELERIAVLEHNGFGIDRYFLHMACPLEALIAEPQLPAGFTLATGPHDPEMWAQLFNESFIDHWNHLPLSGAEVAQRKSTPMHRPELDLVAYAPDGTPAAFCLGVLDSAENVRSGRNEGTIALLGTRRDFRKRGLGRALALSGMQALRAVGADVAVLGVDADSPTGATRLYESIGFRTALTRVLYGKMTR
jgi:mycothiol synthase